MKTLLFAVWRAIVFIVSLHHLEFLFDHVLGGYLSKFCQISNSLFNLRNDKVLLEDLWQVLGIELLVVIWFAGRQACWLAWVNLSLRSPLFSFSFFSLLSFWFLLLLAQLVSLSFLVKIGLLPWSGHCRVSAMGI